MLAHADITARDLRRLIRSGAVRWAGNKKLKIYGRLTCWSGRRRLKRENRVFFATESQALADGYRPCGHCMRTKR